MSDFFKFWNGQLFLLLIKKRKHLKRERWDGRLSAEVGSPFQLPGPRPSIGTWKTMTNHLHSCILSTSWIWANFPSEPFDFLYDNRTCSIFSFKKIKKATRIIRSRTGMRAGKLIIWGRQKWPPVYSNGRPQHVLQGTTWFPRYSGWRLWGTFASKGRWHRLGSRLHGLASSKSTTRVDYKNE